MIRKNICYILGAPKLAGAETLVLNTIKYLDKSKYNIFLILRNDKEALFAEFDKLDIKILFLDVRTIVQNFHSIFKLVDYLKANEIDIIHIHLVGNFLFPTIAALIAKIKVRIVHLHNTYNPTKYKVFKIFLIRFGCYFATNVIAISDVVKEHNVNKFRLKESKIVVIENAIDIKENYLPFNPKVINSALKIGSVGRLVEQKGFDILIKAISKVVESYPNLLVEIVGDGPLRDKLKKMVSDLGLDNNIILDGNIPFLEIAEKYEQWSFFVLSSNWEGFGLVILEAMSHKLPVVATDIDNIPFLVKSGENGFLCKKGDSDCFAEKILILLRNGKLRESMGLNGYELVKNKYSFYSYIEKLEQVYSKQID